MSNLGIHIEGLGVDVVAGNKGVVYCVGEYTPSDNRTWQQQIVSAPSTVGGSVELGDGSIDVSDISLQLNYIADVTRVLFAQQRDPVGEVTTAVDAAATQIEMSGATVGKVAYIGEETVRVISDAGGGVYNVERGFWGSKAAAHHAGQGVYSRPPFYRNRIVSFLSYDGSTVETRERAYLRDMYKPAGSDVISVETRGVLAAIKGVEANRGAYPIPNAEVKYFDANRIVIDIDKQNFEPRAAKKTSPSAGGWRSWYLTTTTTTGWMQADDIISPLGNWVHYVPSHGRETTSKVAAWEGNTIEQKGAPSEYEHVDSPVWELCAWHRDTDTLPYPKADAEQVFDNAFQPLAVFAAIVCSSDSDTIDPDTLDFVNGNFGLDARWLFGDTGIQKLIDLANTDSDIEIDQLILGWDGEPFDVLETLLFKLLIPYGYLLGQTTDGYLYPFKFGPMDVSGYGAAKSNVIKPLFDEGGAIVMGWKPGYAAAIQAYTAKVGKTPVFDGQEERGLALDASARLTKLIEPSRNELDFSTLRTDRVDAVRAILTRQAAILRRSMPTLKVLAEDYKYDGLDYDIGAWATIDIRDVDPDLLVDETGEPVNVTGAGDRALQFGGVIFSRTWNTEIDTYVLELALTNYTAGLGRWRAPSFEVSANAAAGATTISCDSTTGTFNTSGTDADQFKVGMWVVLCDKDLAIRDATPREVVGTATGSITIGSAFSVDPVVGDIIELADKNTNKDYTVNGTRPFVFFADSNGQFSTGEEADQWQ